MREVTRRRAPSHVEMNREGSEVAKGGQHIKQWLPRRRCGSWNVLEPELFDECTDGLKLITTGLPKLTSRFSRLGGSQQYRGEYVGPREECEESACEGACFKVPLEIFPWPNAADTNLVDDEREYFTR